MGYNTTVLILNDSLDVLEKNPEEFTKKLVGKILSMEEGDVGVSGHVNPVYVMPTAHADVFRLYCTHGNSIVELSRWNRHTMEMARDEQHPYRREFLERCIRSAQGLLTDLKKELRACPAPK
jgi:hypothetical protein